MNEQERLQRAREAADDLVSKCEAAIALARANESRNAQVLISAGNVPYVHDAVREMVEQFATTHLKMNGIRATIEMIKSENDLSEGTDRRVYHKHARWLEITF